MVTFKYSTDISKRVILSREVAQLSRLDGRDQLWSASLRGESGAVVRWESKERKRRKRVCV